MLSRTPTGRTDPKAKDASTPAEAPRAGLAKKPSDRLNPKAVNPMGTEKHKTAFSSTYAKGGIPCRLSHGSVKHKLSWTRAPENLPYNPLLATFIEGLKETKHPYTFVVREGIKEMLAATGAAAKVVPLISSIVPPLRAALVEKDSTIFISAVNCLTLLMELLGVQMVPFLSMLIPPLASRALAPDVRKHVGDALRVIEVAGGEGALKILRDKVPTYSPIF
ncbi:PACRG-like protein-like protein [Blyttiomyces helicus]|uniref:PACRG-like protein-like protein n=1 Tax=Blyttiomyces helicus TaxID=388810 RepID=A0A4P9WKZ5_9FUNG|nr:PACRG-like protein-like protein [Blyttiomyces helicus]|eukprot:RKO93062.1 PACRG-like protein-like protein [Blyttiomyces helicus]